MIKILDNLKKNKAGFTIMELLAVIFIISVSFVSTMTLANQNIQASNVNHNSIIASQLCQEALELCRNIRDNNWLAGNNWKNGDGVDTNTNIIQDGVYSIDIDKITNTTGINDPAAKLYLYESTDGFYRHGLVPPLPIGTPFSRIVTVKAESPTSVTLECMVQWGSGQRLDNIAAQTILYDWR